MKSIIFIYNNTENNSSILYGLINIGSSNILIRNRKYYFNQSNGLLSVTRQPC